nr:extracellular calcium-sensing receptor-like [Paramormyrops kingsleyae]
MPSLSRRGDIMIGGIFPVFNKQDYMNPSYQAKPSPAKCIGFDLRAFRWTQMMMFAIDEINNSNTLLPNVSLGYQIYDSCASPTRTLQATLTLLDGQKKEEEAPQACYPPLSAVIAESGSSQSIAVAGLLGPFHVPMVSYFSTCACLSNKRKYPTFFRTIPSDYHQAKALAFLVKRFGWTWIGAIQSDNDYGRNGIQSFTEEVQKMGVCLAFIGTVLRTYPRNKILKVVETIKQSDVKVILAFVPEGDLYPLMQEVVLQNITGIQWIASEAWITAARPSTPENFQSFGGAIGYVTRKMAIPKLRDFLVNIRPTLDPEVGFVNDFWESMVGCDPRLKYGAGESRACTGNETLDQSQNPFFNVTELRVTYNVHKAVYAIAHSLHELIFCKTQSPDGASSLCVNVSQIEPQQVTNYLKKVHFINSFGEMVFFDENGNPPPSYDIVNWQLIGGRVQHVTVGHFGPAPNGSYELQIKDNDIIWHTGKLVPAGFCSAICPVGKRKAQIKGRAVCCFDCIPCADGTIANTTGASDCTPCPETYWSSDLKDRCIPKEMEFLSYRDTMGITLTALSLCGACLAFVVMAVFARFRDTPVVKANNSELSSLLLLSLLLCFLCPFAFIGRPTASSCMLRHTAFGVTFALCISCVLGKTMVVVAVFRANLPNNNMARKFGPAQQRAIVCLCTAVQILICSLWLSLKPPFPEQNLRLSNKKIILECNPGSETAFYAVLGYIGLLSAVCFMLAFLARKLPDNFNEAKFITFSMLIFCAVWLTFIPAYVSSPGKYTVAVEIFAILSSTFGLLACIFVPKCYIILLKPERNTRRHVMGKMSSKHL